MFGFNLKACLALLAASLVAADCPDRQFSILAMSKNGLGSLSTTYQAVVDPGDGGKKYAEVTSCFVGRWGKGCSWLNDDETTTKNSEFTIKHSSYEAHTPNSLDVTVSGDDCDDQVQKCKGEVSTFFDPESGSLFYTSTTRCAEGEAPTDFDIFSEEDKEHLADILLAHPGNGTNSRLFVS